MSFTQLARSHANVEMKTTGTEDSSSSTFDYDAMEMSSISFSDSDYETNCELDCELENDYDFNNVVAYVRGFCAVKTPFIGENRLTVSIDIELKRFNALVDTGATTCFIHDGAGREHEITLE